MSTILKRKRKYSEANSDAGEDAIKCVKRPKYEKEYKVIETNQNTSETVNVRSSPSSVASFVNDDQQPSSSLFMSDTADDDDYNDANDDNEPCEGCELEKRHRRHESETDGSRLCGEVEQLPLARTRSSSELEELNDLENDLNNSRPLESDIDESKECADFMSSPNSSYSSYNERISESAFSSPVAESILDSELDNELVETRDNNEPQENRYMNPGKAQSFMGQITPEPSARKLTQDVESRSWTSSVFKLSAECGDVVKADCPVPQLAWAKREEFWEVMCRKDAISLKTRDAELFNFQQYLRPRMRVILLDWISEVAEVCKLHRETYYLTVDYIDRYLSCVENIPKSQLQLIGITCLALASKMEEIYPPKIDLFAEMTANTYTVNDILAMEIVILKRLNWILSPITVNNWLQMMLQFIYEKEKKSNDILKPQFSSTLFKKLCQLLDLATLDITSLRFSYGVLVASAIYILVNPELALYTSGLSRDVLEPCVKWMTVYWNVLNKSEMIDVSGLLKDDREIYFRDQTPELQTYSKNTMQLYDLVQDKFEILAAQKENKPNTSHTLTPPSSSSKSTTLINDITSKEDAR